MLEQSLEKLGNIRLSRGHSAKIWTLVGLGWGAEIFVGFFFFFFLGNSPTRTMLYYNKRYSLEFNLIRPVVLK